MNFPLNVYLYSQTSTALRPLRDVLLCDAWWLTPTLPTVPSAENKSQWGGGDAHPQMGHLYLITPAIWLPKAQSP